MLKILVAEDETLSQNSMRKNLKKLGHTAFISPDGKHAYQALLTNNDFDLLITDMVMPEMDGRELIKTIRESKKSFKDIPIIIMSAYVSIKQINDLMEKGATLFIPKPVSISDLKENLKLIR